MKKLRLKKKKEQDTLGNLDWSAEESTTEKQVSPAPQSPRQLTRWLLLGGMLGVGGIAAWALLPRGGQGEQPPTIVRPLPPAEASPSGPTVILQPAPSSGETVVVPGTPSSSTPPQPGSPRPSTAQPTPSSGGAGKSPFRSLEAGSQKAKPPREVSPSAPSISSPPPPTTPLPLPPVPAPVAATPPPPPRPPAKLLGLIKGASSVAVLMVGNQTYYVRVGEEVQGLGKLIEVKDRCVTTKDKGGRTRLCTEE